jgi:uncharacterized protein YjbI with pentapeptide repeats
MRQYVARTLFFTIASLALTSKPNASVPEFHYNPNTFSCTNADGKAGLNLDFLGECGDQSGATLSGKSMVRMVLRGANLEKADFSRANLHFGKLDGVQASLARLDHSILESAVLNHANLKNASLQNASLPFASLYSANIDGANFTGADLRYADLQQVMGIGIIGDPSHIGPNFDSAILFGSFLRGATISNASFRKSDFRHANLVASNIESSDFSNADLSYVYWGGRTPVFNNNFSNAKMYRISTWGSAFIQCNFTNTDLTEADLRSTYLKDSTFEGAKLTGALFDEHTALPFDWAEAERRGMVYQQERVIQNMSSLAR